MTFAAISGVMPFEAKGGAFNIRIMSAAAMLVVTGYSCQLLYPVNCRQQIPK